MLVAVKTVVVDDGVEIAMLRARESFRSRALVILTVAATLLWGLPTAATADLVVDPEPITPQPSGHVPTIGTEVGSEGAETTIVTMYDDIGNGKKIQPEVSVAPDEVPSGAIG